MAYRFPRRPPGTDFSDSFSVASSIGDYLEVGDGAYRLSAAHFLSFEEEQNRRRHKHQFHLPRYRQTTLHEYLIPKQRQSPLAMSRFPGRPQGSPTPDHFDLFSNSFSPMASSLNDYIDEGNNDCPAFFVEDFLHSLDADANDDDIFWR